MADLNIPLTIKELRNEAPDYLSITFARPREVIYQPGDWVDIRFPKIEFPVGRTYSFASSPTEPDLLITFRKGVSKFKKALEQVKASDIMLITQYGSNGFLLDKRFQSVFIAGGIGVAPFRSMIKESIDTNAKLDMILIFQNHTANFPFRKELDAWQQTYPYLKIHYLVTGQEGRLTKIPNMHMLQKIADALGVKVKDLIPF